MKPRCPAFAFVLIAALASASALAAPVISPFAANLSASSYTADSTYAGTSAMAAFNGTGYWNAGNWGTHWIQADMGSVQALSEVMLTIAQSPNGATWHNVYLSDTPIGDTWQSLTPVATQSGNTTHGQILDLTFTPTSGRYLEIVSNGGSSWTALGANTPAVSWTDTGALAPAVPEPESYALMLVGLGLIGVAARRNKSCQSNIRQREE